MKSHNMRLKKNSWLFNSAFLHEQKIATLFSTFKKTQALFTEQQRKQHLNNLIKHIIDNKIYYIKYYRSPGRHLRQYVGRSRARGEWENNQYFSSLNIPAPRLIAYGEQYHFRRYEGGILVIDGLENTYDLRQTAEQYPQQLANRKWLVSVLSQVAQYLHKLHANRFAHRDFKWRNILVSFDEKPQVYLIDCPLGKRWIQPFFNYQAIRDLADFDKRSRRHISKTMRLRAYMAYRQVKKLTEQHKKHIKKIIDYGDKLQKRKNRV